MSNVQHLTAMTKQERLAAVLEAYAGNGSQFVQASLGLKHLAKKERAVRRARTQQHVVQRVRASVVGGKEITVHEYLSNDFVPGTAERKWDAAYNAAYFDGPKDAERAARLKGEGSVMPVSDVPIPGNALDRNVVGRGRGLGL